MNLKEMSKASWGPARARKVEAPFAIFHGGLGPGDSRGHEKGRPDWLVEELRGVAKVVQARLRKLASAEDLCLSAVEDLEKREVFNAGRGSKLQADGVARLSASIMDGSRQRMASVFNVRSIIHPSKLARLLLDEEDRCLAGKEANDFAFERGFRAERPETEFRIQQWKQKLEQKTGTVGCVAIDSEGKTFAATSTGGRGMERPGRVSDSATPAGNFANRFGAVSATGVGEDILDVSLASAIVTRLEDGMSLQDAVSRSFFRHTKRHFGIIGLDSSGFAIAHATGGTLSFGVVTRTAIYVGVQNEDWRQFLTS